MDRLPEGKSMIAAELRGDNRPSLNEALGWIGSRVDDIYGAGIGRLEDVWIDPGTGEPRWLLIKEGRFGGRATLIPFEDATAGAGHVWVPYERDVVRDAPQIEPGAPLTQQVELSLRRHYAANSPAAFERAEHLGSTVERMGDDAPAETTSRSAGDEPPSPRMPERPAPPVPAPDVSERRVDPEREDDLRRPAFDAAEGSRREEEGVGRSAPRSASAPTDAPGPGPEAQPQAGPPPGYPAWPPPAPAYFQPLGWPYPPPAPYGSVPYPPPGYPPFPPYPGYAAAPEAPADPLAGLSGREVEIELEGPVTISGRVRSVRFKPDSGESDPGR